METGNNHSLQEQPPQYQQETNLLFIDEDDDNRKDDIKLLEIITTSTSNSKKDTISVTAAKLKNKLKNVDFLDENKINKTSEMMNDEFEFQIDKSMQDLEHLESIQSDSDNDNETLIGNSNNNNLNKKKSLTKKKEKTSGIASLMSTSSSSDSSSTSDSSSENEGEKIVSTYNPNVSRKPVEVFNQNIAYPPTHPLSQITWYSERRRLSECKEEDEDDEKVSSPLPNLNGSCGIQINGNTNGNTTTVTGTTRQFIVTKTEEFPDKSPFVSVPVPKQSPNVPVSAEPRAEIKELKHLTPKQNSQTIHFPCTSPIKPTVQSLFTQLNPHLDRKFFDTSLIEIREKAVDSDSSLVATILPILDDVWIKRDVVVKPAVSCLY